MTRPPLRLCISDLHLDDARPECSRALVDILDYFKGRIKELYILGDLFNYWIGDDHPPACAAEVSRATRDLPYVGWIFGNRDFLLGTDGFCSASGMTNLAEVHCLTMAGKPAILCHGDQLCTDDLEHQRNRRQYTTKEFQHRLLQKSIAERQAIAMHSRQVSRQRKRTLPEKIVDVNQEAVNSLMAKHQATLLIHGHTHRPALHQHTLGQRLVLGEWTNSRGWCIVEELHRPNISLASFSIPFDAASWQQLATIS